MRHISPSAAIGRDVTLDVERLMVGSNVVIGDGSAIRGGEVTIAAGVRIGREVRVHAERFSAGRAGQIEDGCVLSDLRGAARRIELGDRFRLGASSKILLPTFIAGDYVSIHNHLLANGYRPCLVGHNTWIGQNCILNSNELLTIGNNVSISAYTSIHTHGSGGELLEGYGLFNVAPVVIEDDVSLLGAFSVVSPGVTVGRRAVVISSCVLNQYVPPERCVFAGASARVLSERLRGYKPVTIEEKLALMRKFIAQYVTERYDSHEPTAHGFAVTCADGRARVVEVREEIAQGDFEDGVEGVVYVAGNPCDVRPAGVTVFDLSEKTYRKLGSDFEAEIIAFMNPYRARFVPADRPRIDDLPNEDIPRAGPTPPARGEHPPDLRPQQVGLTPVAGDEEAPDADSRRAGLTPPARGAPRRSNPARARR
jgi:acetyltransferase-like isoleucine patch superfamily enzyme